MVAVVFLIKCGESVKGILKFFHLDDKRQSVLLYIIVHSFESDNDDDLCFLLR